MSIQKVYNPESFGDEEGPIYGFAGEQEDPQKIILF
jgi:hypothetical protein